MNYCMLKNVFKALHVCSLLLPAFFSPGAVSAAEGSPSEDFHYKHQEGDRYRILSTVYQDVFIDMRLSHRAEILNRIAVEVGEVNDGRGWHRAVFQTSERAVAADARTGAAGAGRSYNWAREYESEFERDRLGRMNIESRFFMPVVRDVPVFPGRYIAPGETWSYEGHEVHDFRDNFGIEEPYRIPFTANYEYLGERVWKDRTLPAFSVSYRVQSDPPPVRGRIWPRRIRGASDQIVYWDSELGQPVAYTEEYRYVFELSNGRTIEYRGTAYAEIIESVRMDRERLAEEIAEEIERMDIADVTVRVVDEGITISLDNIQFIADTAVMLPGEREKLDMIVEILLRYQERDLLIACHAAPLGSRDFLMNLSQERAAFVADYLIERNVRSPQQVVARGYGADRPIADNSTEEGRSANRRVEIILLEN